MNEQIPVNYHLVELQIIEKLSERAKNACLDNSLDSLFKVLNFYKKNGNFMSLMNCGSKTNDELVELAKKYMEDYEVIANIVQTNDSYSIFDEYKLFCFTHFKLKSNETEVYRNHFVEGRFPFFQFILLILKNLFNERDYYLFKHNFDFFLDSRKHTLQAIGLLFNNTRERIRQISLDMPYRIKNLLLPFSNELGFIENHLQYNLKRYKDYIAIDKEIQDKINSTEELQCTSRFFAFGFSMLYHKQYYFFQEPLSNYKQYYLINRKLAEQFDFAEFYHDLNLKTSSYNLKSYTIDFRHYIRSFFRPGKFSYFERIVEMCKQIVSGEFGLRCNINDELPISGNERIKISDHVVNILEETGRPMHLNEISSILQARKLRQTSNLDTLRLTILTQGSIVPIGKTSTYALAKWKHIKTGTIKQLIKEYLESQDHPIHLSALQKYLNQFRKTSEKSIYSNLKLDKSGTYVFFPGSFIGVSSKKYLTPPLTNKQLSLLL